MSLMSIFEVNIDFDSSHTVFPIIVSSILLVLFIAILVTRYQEMAIGLGGFTAWLNKVDKARFFGTIIAVAGYFWAMEWIGYFFPNQGLGFLFSSMLFVLFISLLYMHQRNRRSVMTACLNAGLTPVFVWFVLAHLFNVSLP